MIVTSVVAILVIIIAVLQGTSTRLYLKGQITHRQKNTGDCQQDSFSGKYKPTVVCFLKVVYVLYLVFEVSCVCTVVCAF